MPTNPVFSHYGTDTEQSILDDLTAEAIQVAGVDMLYMPRHIFNKNPVLGEDPESYFTDAIPIEIYILNVEGFQGDGNFLSKFGLEIRDRIMLSVSISRFKTLIGDPFGLARPNEGDLIYFPLNKKIFEIRYTDPWTMFFPLGSLYTYQLTCELYEFGSEKITTTVPDIDNIEQFSEDLYRWAIYTEDGRALVTENGNILVVDNYDPSQIMKLNDANTIHQQANTVLDFSETNPYGSL